MARDPLAIMNAVASAMSNPKEKAKKAVMAKKDPASGAPQDPSAGAPPQNLQQMRGKAPAKANF